MSCACRTGLNIIRLNRELLTKEKALAVALLVMKTMQIL